jgi:hypothetical protein
MTTHPFVRLSVVRSDHPDGPVEERRRRAFCERVSGDEPTVFFHRRAPKRRDTRFEHVRRDTHVSGRVHEYDATDEVRLAQSERLNDGPAHRGSEAVDPTKAEPRKEHLEVVHERNEAMGGRTGRSVGDTEAAKWTVTRHLLKARRPRQRS